MPSNKKPKSYLVKPQGATATARKKQNPKVERAAKVITGLAVALTPLGRTSSALAKVATKVTPSKFISTGAKTKKKTFTQGSTSKIEGKMPKNMGASSYSPLKGSKFTVEWKTKGMSVKQGQSLGIGRITQKVKPRLSKAQGAAGTYIATKPTKSKSKKK